MRKLRISIVMIIMALSIAAIGSAAISSLTFERSVAAGQILLDTDPNVAVQITNNSSYPNLVVTNPDGKISLNLNEAINNSSSGGFNTDATYSIGTFASGVVKIKNNSDVDIIVTLTNDVGNLGALTLLPSNNASPTIAVGTSRDFYFVLDTTNQDAVKAINAVLKVEGIK